VCPGRSSISTYGDTFLMGANCPVALVAYVCRLVEIRSICLSACRDPKCRARRQSVHDVLLGRFCLGYITVGQFGREVISP
jgi:hypothetical protein